MDDMNDMPQIDYVELTTDLIAAYVSNNSLRASDLLTLIADVHAAFAGLSNSSAKRDAPELDKPTPAQIRKSITPDALISFVDGKPYKTLRRHLTTHGLTIEAYRARYGLPVDYPTVAARYSEARSALAKSLGLGQLRDRATPEDMNGKPSASEAPRKGRPRKAQRAATAE